MEGCESYCKPHRLTLEEDPCSEKNDQTTIWSMQSARDDNMEDREMQPFHVDPLIHQN